MRDCIFLLADKNMEAFQKLCNQMQQWFAIESGQG
jgi:hypothetical protein